MSPIVALTATVLHGGFQRDAGDELDVDEATAESLLERGLAEKPGRPGRAPAEPAWHAGLEKDDLLKVAGVEGVDVDKRMGKTKLVELIDAHRARADEVIHGDLRVRDYDPATPEEIAVFVGAADQGYAEAVLAYEREHQNRDDVIAVIQARLAELAA